MNEINLNKINTSITTNINNILETSISPPSSSNPSNPSSSNLNYIKELENEIKLLNEVILIMKEDLQVRI